MQLKTDDCLAPSIKALSGSFTDKGFNFAKSSATSNDLEDQARDLLSALESDQRIDMNTFWKVSD